MSTSIERLVIKNYGCCKDVDIKLTPLHCFIGPNDSGKSTILRTMQILSTFLHREQDKQSERSQLRESLYANINAGEVRLEAFVENQSAFWTLLPPSKANGSSSEHISTHLFEQFPQALTDVRMMALVPRALQASSPLIPEDQPVDLKSTDGSGLPGVYDAILNRDVEAFLAIQKRVRELFPTVAKVQLRNISDREKAIDVELKTGSRVPAHLMSNGLLYFLAFAALPHLKRSSVLLLEEPENGLHPARIKDVIRIIRDVSLQTQVLIATHSPLVVNELKPEEVSIVTRTIEEGSRVTPIIATPNFEQRSRIYALGELWISYADGNLEAPLLNFSGND